MIVTELSKFDNILSTDFNGAGRVIYSFGMFTLGG